MEDADTHFLPWINSSIINFYLRNYTYTQLKSFNYSSQSFNVISDINTSLTITKMNNFQNEFVTERPVQLYSFKNSHLDLLLNTTYDTSIWDDSFSRAIGFNFDSVILFDYDSNTNTMISNRILFKSMTRDTKQLLNLINYFNLISTIVSFIAIIVVSKLEHVWDLDYL